MTAKRLDTVKEYYFSKKLREVSAMIAKGKPIINMGIGSPSGNKGVIARPLENLMDFIGKH